MAERRLSDIPSIRKLLAQADGAAALTAILRYVPFLGRVMGLSNVKVKELHSTAGETTTKAREMVSVLDRFHAHFAREGWIFYENMDVPAAARAVELADRGDLEGARDALLGHYSDERIGFHLIRLAGLDCGRERRRLLSLAREDYAAGRYHACVPVVLAQLDGMVNDLQQLGFFAEGSDLTAHDSLAGHSEGLTRVAGFFRKGRNKTRTEDLAIPYRNGIMHGTDLGYDNQVVAAKCWAALFATMDWAGLVERGHRDRKPEPPSPSFGEVFGKMSEDAEVRRALDAWKPRSVRVGVDFPASGNPEEYGVDTPERVVVEFLSGWQARNYGRMAALMASAWGDRRALPATLRNRYRERVLRGFELVSCEDKAAAVTEVTIALHLEGGVAGVPDATFRMICETEEGQPMVRGRGGRWFVISAP